MNKEKRTFNIQIMILLMLLIGVIICTGILIKNAADELKKPTYTIEIIEHEIIEEPVDESTFAIIEHIETVEVLTNLLYGEARGIPSDTEKAGVIWCVLNRYDTGCYGNTIIEVATAPNQFNGYIKNRTYSDMNSYHHCKEIVIDVLTRYYTENQEGRVLPAEYLYFYGKDGRNVFTTSWKSNDYWNWTLESPYN